MKINQHNIEDESQIHQNKIKARSAKMKKKESTLMRVSKKSHSAIKQTAIIRKRSMLGVVEDLCGQCATYMCSRNKAHDSISNKKEFSSIPVRMDSENTEKAKEDFN